ncbi:protein of unknown function [Magnetospirillum sp. XM-1]|nr:protein of unknown function [Magnetospirillum sp. XM-1]
MGNNIVRGEVAEGAGFEPAQGFRSLDDLANRPKMAALQGFYRDYHNSSLHCPMRHPWPGSRSVQAAIPARCDTRMSPSGRPFTAAPRPPVGARRWRSPSTPASGRART